MAGTGDPHRFEFDLDRGIKAQVIEQLEGSPSAALVKGCAPPESGIYALYFRGELVYIGKASKGTTKSHRTLRARLNEHCGKISGRQNIRLADMSCRFLTFTSEWWVIAAEFAPAYPTISQNGTTAGSVARCQAFAGPEPTR